MSDQNQPPKPQYPGAGGPQYGPPQGQGPRQHPGQNQWPQQGRPSAPQHGQPQGPYGQPQGQRPGPQQPPQYGQQPGPQGYPQQQPMHPQQAPHGPQGQQYGGPQQGGQPQGQYGQPGQASYEQMHVGGQPPQGPGYGDQQWQPEPKKKRGKLIPIVAALAMVLVVAGGGIFAYGKLAGGKQPADVLPGTAVAYARVDLNPSAGQKVAAIRFMMKFPSVKDKLGLTGDKDDLRQKLFDQIKKSSGDDLANVDYDKDIKPWLGDRAGIAALPPADGKTEPDVVVAVQVKNQDAANKGMDKLLANEDKKPGRAFSNGYMLLSDDQATVDSAVATAKDNPLTKNAKFSADMDKLGEQGFLSGWADVKGIASITGKVDSGQLAGLGDATTAVALRFDASYVELKGIGQGDKSIKVNSAADAGDLVSKLPDTTAGAIAISGGENLIDTAWQQVQKAGGENLKPMLDRIAEETGLALPDDLKSLAGKNLAVAIDKDTANGPKIAARMETDPAKAEPVVQKLTTLLRQRSSANIPIETAKDNDTLVVSTSQEYAQQVLKDGNLGQSENFKQALPDTKGAVMIGYVDFESIGSLSRRFAEEKDLAALRSAGIVTRSTGDGQAEFSLRVVAK
ncbi:DUF3352 domain-containing protein [Kribbella sp. NPDC051586]|uniref:DUF3352 domain-containing protein n=1 Tax=Kribbella sp. NPDC051586 TaxID=3364118 RepID=UPI0037AF8E44